MLPVLAIPLVPFSSSNNYLNNEQNSITCDQEQVISSYSATTRETTVPIQGVSANPDTMQKISDIMYSWELDSLLKYESQNKIPFTRSTLVRNLWQVPDDKLSVAAIITNSWMKSLPDQPNQYEIGVIVTDNKKQWSFPPIIIQFQNVQLPTRFLLLQDSLKKLIPSNVVDTVFTSGIQIKKNIYCNIPDGPNYVGENLKLIDFHNNNDQVMNLYPQNQAFYAQPATVFSVKSYDDDNGTIILNVNFNTGDQWYNPFSIAYFDNSGNPVRFSDIDNSLVVSGFNHTFELTGFQVKTSPFMIFNGPDGQFLMYELIGVGSLLFLTILYTIIHISRRNRRISSVRKIDNRQE